MSGTKPPPEVSPPEVPPPSSCYTTTGRETPLTELPDAPLGPFVPTPPRDPEEEFRLFTEGDCAAFARLVRELHPLLVAVALRGTGDRWEAEGLASAAEYDVWTKRTELVGGVEGFKACAVAGVQGRVSNWRRSTVRRLNKEVLTEDDGDAIADVVAADDAVQQRQDLEDLEFGMKSIPAVAGKIVLMRQEDLTWDEIATATALPVSQVRRVHTAALTMLRKAIARKRSSLGTAYQMAPPDYLLWGLIMALPLEPDVIARNAIRAEAQQRIREAEAQRRAEDDREASEAFARFDAKHHGKE